VDEYPIGTFEPSDLAYEAFVSDCLEEGIDPSTADPIAFVSGEDWQQGELDPFYGELLDGETVEW
jgi:hypothetical protein